MSSRLKSRTGGKKGIVYVSLRTNEIPFTEIADEVLRYAATLGPARFGRIRLAWFVCSPQGGIYLHEALATKQNTRYGKAKHTFIVINTDNGTISLGPGHPKNGMLTDSMRSLLERFRLMQRDVWLGEMFGIFDACHQNAGSVIR